MHKLPIVLMAAALAACVAVSSDRPTAARAEGPAKSHGHGPPPHAPAHGYRAKTRQGVAIVFDTKVGVYVVVDVPGNYWLDDRYFRMANSSWVVSASIDGPWTACPQGDLPAGLRSSAPKPGKAKKSKGNSGN